MLKKPTLIKKETDLVSQKPKYERPKVLVIDLGGEPLETLQRAGYNVSDATFGLTVSKRARTINPLL